MGAIHEYYVVSSVDHAHSYGHSSKQHCLNTPSSVPTKTRMASGRCDHGATLTTALTMSSSIFTGIISCAKDTGVSYSNEQGAITHTPIHFVEGVTLYIYGGSGG